MTRTFLGGTNHIERDRFKFCVNQKTDIRSV